MGKPTIQYFDTLRAWATLGVIIIHVSTPALKMNFGKNDEFWWIANIIDSAVRGIVPLFLMLTGATMLGRQYNNIGDFYKKRLQRVFVPFLFWMVLYWVYFWIKLPVKKQPHELIPILEWAYKLLTNTGISKHFWYFYMILAVYLFVPYLARLVQKASRNQLIGFIVVWALFCYATRGISMNMYGWTVAAFPGKLLGWFVHAGYLVVGYYLATLPASSARFRWTSAGVFILSVVSCASFTWYFTRQSGKLDLSMYGYVKPNTILQAMALFLMIKDSQISNKVYLWVQNQVCTNSYGIYLAHVIALNVLFDNGYYWKIAYPAISIPLVSLTALLMCYVFVFLLRKVPGGQYVAG